MRAPVRKSLLRKIAWFGGDRRIVGFSALLLFCIGWTMVMGLGFFYGLSYILPVALFAVILWVARSAFEADPFMVDVVLRQFKYRKFYAAKSDLGVEHPPVKDYV